MEFIQKVDARLQAVVDAACAWVMDTFSVRLSLVIYSLVMLMVGANLVGSAADMARGRYAYAIFCTLLGGFILMTWSRASTTFSLSGGPSPFGRTYATLIKGVSLVSLLMTIVSLALGKTEADEAGRMLASWNRTADVLSDVFLLAVGYAILSPPNPPPRKKRERVGIKQPVEA